MVYPERFYDLLFEVSNEYRHQIMLNLKEEPKRITELSKTMNLTTQEVSRHLSRLSNTRLILKNVDGTYRLTPLGDTVLLLLEEIRFTSKYTKYLADHQTSHLDLKHLKTIGKLCDTKLYDNMMEFLHVIEKIIEEAEEFVWLQADDFPMILLNTFIDALNRGITLNILIEEKAGPIVNFELMTEPLKRVLTTPLVQERVVKKNGVYQLLSERRGIIAFPNETGDFDFTGLETQDKESYSWCKEYFIGFWENAGQRRSIEKTAQGRRATVTEGDKGVIMVVGREDPSIDPFSVQDAVDHYNEVVLSGVFNFGPKSVTISRSVVLRGEGRENNVPSTKVYKKNWVFPFRDYDQVFYVQGDGVEVTIENIHITDFNCIAIYAENGSKLVVKDNRITLGDGLARGMTYGPYGDIVMGIFASSLTSDMHGLIYSFPKGIQISGNYLDFATNYVRGGYISRGGVETDPQYRPDLFDHKHFISEGIIVNFAAGEVLIEKNVIKNMNSRGIYTFGNASTAETIVKENIIESKVYGAYAYFGNDAGIGICAQTAWSAPTPNYYLEIRDNSIKCEKLNYSGICVFGPIMSRGDSDVFRGGKVIDNSIELDDGYIGVHLRKSHEFEVENNEIRGASYYGVKISGRRQTDEMDARGLNNCVKGTHLKGLRVKKPDQYSDLYADGNLFFDGGERSDTSHFWLDKNTANNVIEVGDAETIIDEGTENKIIT